MQTEVFSEPHTHMVTTRGTLVNVLSTDNGQQNGYSLCEMEYPNRLAELMRAKGLSGSELARLAGTSKQQVHKLQRGDRKLAREWAERFAPHLGVTWPEVMGWTGNLPLATPDPRPQRQTIGARMCWIRQYRQVDVAAAAEAFGMTQFRLNALEAGTTDLTVPELTVISARLRVPADFLLLGRPGDLPFEMGQEWEAYIQEFLSRRPTRTG